MTETETGGCFYPLQMEKAKLGGEIEGSCVHMHMRGVRRIDWNRLKERLHKRCFF